MKSVTTAPLARAVAALHLILFQQKGCFHYKNVFPRILLHNPEENWITFLKDFNCSIKQKAVHHLTAHYDLSQKPQSSSALWTKHLLGK